MISSVRKLFWVSTVCCVAVHALKATRKISPRDTDGFKQQYGLSDSEISGAESSHFSSLPVGKSNDSDDDSSDREIRSDHVRRLPARSRTRKSKNGMPKIRKMKNQKRKTKESELQLKEAELQAEKLQRQLEQVVQDRIGSTNSKLLAKQAVTTEPLYLAPKVHPPLSSDRAVNYDTSSSAIKQKRVITEAVRKYSVIGLVVSFLLMCAWFVVSVPQPKQHVGLLASSAVDASAIDCLQYECCVGDLNITSVNTTYSCQVIVGTLEISKNFVGEFDAAVQIPRLKIIQGHVFVSTVPGLISFDLGGCSTILGKICFSGNTNLTRITISNLQFITGNLFGTQIFTGDFGDFRNIPKRFSRSSFDDFESFYLYGNPKLENVTLPSLISIDGGMFVGRNVKLTTLFAPSLKEIFGEDRSSFQPLQSHGVCITENHNLQTVNFLSLTTIAGALLVIDNDHPPNNDLPESFVVQNITSIGHDLDVRDRFISVLQLPNLVYVKGFVYLRGCNSRSCPVPTPFFREFRMEKLEYVGSRFLMQQHEFHVVDFPNLKSIGSSCSISSNNLWSIRLQSLKSIGEYLSVQGDNLRSLILPSLMTVGNIQISNLPALVNFEISNLTSVGEGYSSPDFSIGRFPSLLTLEFPQLSYIACSLHFWENNFFSIELPKLRSIDGKIKVLENNYLTSLSMPSLVSVKDTVHIYENGMLRDLSMPVLTSVGGLEIHDSTTLSSIKLPSLESIANQLAVRNMKVEMSFELPEVRTVGSNVAFSDNNIAAIHLPKLESIGGYLFLSNNNDNLAAVLLPKLVRIQGNVLVCDYSENPLPVPEIQFCVGDAEKCSVTSAFVAMVESNVDLSVCGSICISAFTHPDQHCVRWEDEVQYKGWWEDYAIPVCNDKYETQVLVRNGTEIPNCAQYDETCSSCRQCLDDSHILVNGTCIDP